MLRKLTWVYGKFCQEHKSWAWLMERQVSGGVSKGHCQSGEIGGGSVVEGKGQGERRFRLSDMRGVIRGWTSGRFKINWPR